jgi:hypothetical protein
VFGGTFVVKGFASQTTIVLEESGGASLAPSGDLTLIPFIESGPMEIGDGDQVMRVQQIVPDEKNLGDVNARLFTALFPTDTEIELGPYALNAPTSVRFTARQIRLRLEEATAGNWRVGITRIGVIPGGRR